MPTVQFMPSPQEEALESLTKWLEGHEPISDVLSLEGERISISDLTPLILAFRDQRRILQDFNLLCPAVRLQRVSGEVEWVPFDIRGKSAGPMPGAPTRLRVIERLEARISEGMASGLDIQPVEIATATNSFTNLASEIIVDRLGHTRVDQSPPEDVFTVTTDSQRVEIVFAQGIYVSTSEGFGFSTPARRTLPWGFYTFAARIGGKADYSGASLWKVPDVTSIHLDV